MRPRGTVVLLKRENAWKIFHEHLVGRLVESTLHFTRALCPDGKRKRERGTALL